MRSSRPYLSFHFACAVFLAGLPSTVSAQHRSAVETHGLFVPNLGQWHTEVRWRARFGSTTVFLQHSGWVARFDADQGRSAAIAMRFRGATPVEPAGEAPLPGALNFFVGDRERWRTGVPRFARVRFDRLYPGTDLVAYDNAGIFEYDLVLSPGASLPVIEVVLEGDVHLRSDGAALVFETPVGPVQHTAPVAWETDASGARRPITCRYDRRGERSFGFLVPDWDGSTTLTIDPGLVYATLLGGSVDDFPYGVHVHPSTGVLTVSGSTNTPQFPTTLGAFATASAGIVDAFVSQLDPSLPAGPTQLLWSTMLGGNGTDRASEVHVGPAGLVTVSGSSTSTNYPTTPGVVQATNIPGDDAIVTRLDPSQTGAAQLVASTYFGGSGNEIASDLHVDDATGRVTIAGWTNSTALPTSAGAFQTTNAGRQDIYVTTLDPALATVVYSTFLGGTGFDQTAEVEISAGLVYLAGRTRSTDFPVTPTAWSTTSVYRDAYVSVLDPAQTGAQQLVASTYLGGSAGEERVVDLVVRGDVYVSGVTFSTDFPATANAYQATLSGAPDLFVSRLDPALSTLRYSTFLGGNNSEFVGGSGGGIGVSPSGVITIGGSAQAGFPTTASALQPTASQPFPSVDFVVARLDPSRRPAEQLLYSTYYGWGTHNEFARDLAVNALGVTTIVGESRSSTGFTGVNAYQSGWGGGTWDGVVVSFDMLPTGVSAYGTSTPGCDGPQAISAVGVPDASAGNPGFELTCDAVPANSVGFVVIGLGNMDPPARIAGVNVWVDLGLTFDLQLVASTAQGNARHGLPIPANPVYQGLPLFAQFAWSVPTAPSCPVTGISASNALAITLQ